MDRSGIIVHGHRICLYARPTGHVLFELRCRDQRAARVTQAQAARTRQSKQLAANTPLYEAMLTWAWWGTGHLDPTDSWPKYRGTM